MADTSPFASEEGLSMPAEGRPARPQSQWESQTSDIFSMGMPCT